jgi:hypothetical protein
MTLAFAGQPLIYALAGGVRDRLPAQDRHRPPWGKPTGVHYVKSRGGNPTGVHYVKS